MADISSRQQQQPHSTCYGPDFARAEFETQQLIISHQQLEEICHLLDAEFRRGLHRDTNAQANVKMYPTHLIDHKSAAQEDEGAHSDAGPGAGARLDDSHFAEPEEGKFLALDLGGTNFRVILVELDGSQFHMDNEVFSLEQELMHGPGGALFDYIADCLSNFVTRRNLNGHRLPLGFTFSFPCQQESIAHARLINWTKGFKCPDVEGRDVAGLLRESIERRPGLDIEVMAVLNDTTGTLISCAFKNRECRIGLIVGTGTNACYMEEVDNVHAMHPPSASASNSDGDSPLSADEDEPQANGRRRRPNLDPETWRAQHRQKQTVVNTEWGAFGDNGILDFVRTKWDNDVDMLSLNRGKQKFEKMIGGLYVGEICRHVLRHLSLNEKVLFCAHLFEDPNKLTIGDARKFEQREQILQSGPFSRQFSFQTRFVSMVESDGVDQFASTRRALDEAFGINWASESDCAIVKLVCTRVSTRAAHLVSAAVACLLNRMGRPFTVVGVDGSMFKFHPHFHSIMAKKTKELTNPMHRFQLMFSEDGSGKGAAIVASVAAKQRRISAAL